MLTLTRAQANLIDKDNRQTSAAGLPLSDILLDLQDQISTGELGITADPGDIDSLALGGGHFSEDEDNTTGLTWAYLAGRIRWNGKTLVSYTAGTVSLSASATNYVEADSGGSVTANTSGFTSGRCPLWQIVTDASSITTVTIKKHFLSAFSLAGLTGDVLSAAGATKEVVSQLGTISATGDFYVPLPNVAGTIVGARLVTATAVATDNTNYWQISAINLGTAGSGTTDVLDTGAANSTKTTGGSAMVAGGRRTLTLHGTGANLVTAATDVLKLTFTKNGTATTMAGVAVIWDVKFTG